MEFWPSEWRRNTAYRRNWEEEVITKSIKQQKPIEQQTLEALLNNSNYTFEDIDPALSVSFKDIDSMLKILAFGIDSLALYLRSYNIDYSVVLGSPPSDAQEVLFGVLHNDPRLDIQIEALCVLVETIEQIKKLVPIEERDELFSTTARS